MLHVIGDDTSDEYAAAVDLRHMILHAWPTVEHSAAHQLWLVANAKCHGQQRSDIDILLLATLAPGLYYEPFLPFNFGGDQVAPDRVEVLSLCLILEVKRSVPRQIRFDGTQLSVSYKGAWSNVSEQSFQQQFALKKYIEIFAGAGNSPRITGLIWLRSLLTRDLPEPPHNVIGSDITWNSLLNVVGQLQPPWRRGDTWELTCGRPDVLDRTVEVMTKIIQPTELDRKRMERISQRAADSGIVLEQVGQRPVVLRGGGGTGKTMRLLQAAKHLYDAQAARVLLLTYNKALVADIRRMLTFMGVADDIAEPSIQMQTVHSFFHDALTDLGVIPAGDSAWLKSYDRYKELALKYFAEGLLTQADLSAHRKKGSEALSWHFVMVDEGQDWPEDELQLLLHFYDARTIMVADGKNQLVRNTKPAKWREHLSRVAVPYYSAMHTTIRMKANLSRFVNSFSRQLGLPELAAQPNDETPGGRVIVVEGGYLGNQRLHDQLVEYNLNNGNKPVDMLFCVSPSLVQYEPVTGLASSLVAEVFSSWSYLIWDGTSVDVRETYPTDIEQLRIVQYDSCRGLEGWIVVNLDFDGFYNNRLQRYRNLPRVSNTLIDTEHEAHLYAAGWLIIPLTRAMDTLVIQISGQPSPIRDALVHAAAEHSDIVTWQRSPPSTR